MDENLPYPFNRHLGILNIITQKAISQINIILLH